MYSLGKHRLQIVIFLKGTIFIIKKKILFKLLKIECKIKLNAHLR